MCLSLSSRAVAEALCGITPRKPPENLFSDALLLSGVCVRACVRVCVRVCVCPRDTTCGQHFAVFWLVVVFQ